MADNLLIGDQVYIVGHRNPDLDAIASAYVYQFYRHSQGDFNYQAVRCGEPNEVTKWAFKKIWNRNASSSGKYCW